MGSTQRLPADRRARSVTGLVALGLGCLLTATALALLFATTLDTSQLDLAGLYRWVLVFLFGVFLMGLGLGRVVRH